MYNIALKRHCLMEASEDLPRQARSKPIICQDRLRTSISNAAETQLAADDSASYAINPTLLILRY